MKLLLMLALIASVAVMQATLAKSDKCHKVAGSGKLVAQTTITGTVNKPESSPNEKDHPSLQPAPPR